MVREPKRNAVMINREEKMEMENRKPDCLLRLAGVLNRVPVGKSTWWNGVRSGRFPKPVKLGPRTTAWRESEINQVVEGTFPGAK
mgnify:CR=1 FL=1